MGSRTPTAQEPASVSGNALEAGRRFDSCRVRSMLKPELQPNLMVKVRQTAHRGHKGWPGARIISRTDTTLDVLYIGHRSTVTVDLRRQEVKPWASRNPPTPTPPPSLTTVVPKAPPGSGLAVSLAQAFLDGATIDLSSGNLCVPIVPSPPPILREECLAAPTPPPPPEPPPVPAPKPAPAEPKNLVPSTSSKTRTRNTPSFDEKLGMVLALNDIRAAGVPITLSSIEATLMRDFPGNEGFLKTRANIERLLESAKFPQDLILPEPITLTKGTEIHKALQSLSDRLTRIERELGLQP